MDRHGRHHGDNGSVRIGHAFLCCWGKVLLPMIGMNGMHREASRCMQVLVQSQEEDDCVLPLRTRGLAAQRLQKKRTRSFSCCPHKSVGTYVIKYPIRV